MQWLRFRSLFRHPRYPIRGTIQVLHQSLDLCDHNPGQHVTIHKFINPAQHTLLTCHAESLAGSGWTPLPVDIVFADK
jgi:hypothetical protein